MSRSRPWWLPHATFISLVILLVASTFSGCSEVEDEDISSLKNTPPTIWLDGGPPEGSVSVYKIEFSWGGHDPDGSISHFEYCVTDNDGAFDPADTWVRITGRKPQKRATRLFFPQTYRSTAYWTTRSKNSGDPTRFLSVRSTTWGRCRVSRRTDLSRRERCRRR